MDMDSIGVSLDVDYFCASPDSFILVWQALVEDLNDVAAEKG